MALTQISTGGVKNDAVTAGKIPANAIGSSEIADDAVDQGAIADEAVDEARLQISNAGTNGQFLQKQSGNTGGLTWASISSTPEGTAILSTGESGGTKFLREDGDGSCSWQTVSSVPTSITVADESSDTTCNIAFFTGATGDLAPKTGDNLTFNSSTGELEADIIKDSKGDVRKIPQVWVGDARTLVASDAGKQIFTGGNTVTINGGVFTTGDAITIVNNGSSNMTITQGSGITIYNSADATTGNRTLAERGMCTVLISSSGGDAAYISGAGLS